MVATIDSSKEAELDSGVYSRTTAAFESMKNAPEDLLPEISVSVCAFSKVYDSFLQQSEGAFPCMKDGFTPSCNQSTLTESCFQPEEGKESEKESDRTSKPLDNEIDEVKVEVNYDGESNMIVTTSPDGQLASVESVKKGRWGRRTRTRSIAVASGTSRASRRSSATAVSNSPDKVNSTVEKKPARSRSAPRLHPRSRASPPSPVSPVEEFRQSSREKRQPPTPSEPKRVMRTKNVVSSRSLPRNISSTSNKRDKKKGQDKTSVAEIEQVATKKTCRQPGQAGDKPVRYFREGEETLNDNGSSVHMIQLQRIEF